MRPSQPMHHLMVRRKAGLCSSTCRAMPGLPLRAMTTLRTPRSCQLVLDAFVAVTAVGCNGARRASGSLLDTLDRRGQLRRIGGITLLHAVVEPDPVVVVSDLGLATKLDRFTHTALGDRTRIAVVQADSAGSAVRDDSGQSLPGLGDDLAGRGQQIGQVVDRTHQPAVATTRNRVALTASRGFGQLRQPTGGLANSPESVG